jgi:YD repeat-containing protein
LATVSYAGALTVTYTYDMNDRLIGVADSLSGASVALDYDAAGRITTLARSNGVNTTLTYDAADRLTRIQDGAILDLQYTLDAAGDITAANFASAPLLPAVTAEAKKFQYDAASQVRATGFTYDARGRLTTMPGHAFAWDGASRLIALDATTGNAVTLGYDGFGDVTTRTTGGATTRYFYHHAIELHPLVAERAESNSQFTRFYIWTPGGRLLYAVDAATHAPIFYHFDRVGSTLALTDGRWSGHRQLLPTRLTANFSATRAILARAPSHLRSSAPSASAPRDRFTKCARVTTIRSPHAFYRAIPAGPRLGDPRTLDPYLYALGNPTRYVDLGGAEEEEYYAPSASNRNSRARTESFETFFVGFFVSPLISVSGFDVFFGAEDYLDTKVEMPKLRTDEEAFNAELNEVRRKSREMEEFFNHIEAKAAVSIASAPSLGDSPDDDALINAELGIAPSKPDQMIEDAIEETGDGDPAIAEAIPVG